jgi:predicted permease
MAAAMFMNSNSLPIALMQSLVVAVPELMWGSDDSKNIMLGRALTYLTMYSTLGMVIRYSYGIRLLSRADTEIIPRRSGHVDDERTPLLAADLEASSSSIAQHTHHSSTTIVNDSDSDEDALVASPKDVPSPLPPFSGDSTPAASIRPTAQRRRTTFYNSFPNSPNDSRTHLDCYDNCHHPSHTYVDDEAGGPPRRSWFASLPEKFGRTWAAFLDFMTASLWAALFSLIVACIPPLQHALTHHLQPVNGAINSAGKCAVPLTLIVLGAYFYTPPPEQDLDGNTKKPPPVKPNETRTVILAVAARMIITPIVILPLMTLATRYDFHRVFDE